MKILFVTNGYPPHRWAGTETYTAGIAEELLNRGQQVQVLCSGDWETGSQYWNGFKDDVHNGIPVRRINFNWTKAPDPFGYLYNNPIVAEFLVKFLDEVQPDLIHVTSCENLSASVLKVSRDYGKTVVLSLTDFWFLCPRINLLRSDGENCNGITTPWECLRCNTLNTKVYQWPQHILGEEGAATFLSGVSKHPTLTRQKGLRGIVGDMADRKSFLHQAVNFVDYRITASKFVHDIYVADGITSPIKVQPYGHDLSWLDGYSGKTPSNLIRIGFIGQIIHSKGVHLLLEAASSLQDEIGRRFSVTIYGNLDKTPDYGDQLRKYSANIDNLHFAGTYSHKESASIYSNLDLIVVPSLWYDFPLIIYEAFAAQTPVIATNLGGMAEIISHDENGLLFEKGDVEDLSSQIRRVVLEHELLEKLRSGIPNVKSIAEEVDEIELIYGELVQKERSHEQE